MRRHRCGPPGPSHRRADSAASTHQSAEPSPSVGVSHPTARIQVTQAKIHARAVARERSVAPIPLPVGLVALAPMIISTMNDLPGYDIDEVVGEVFGLTVR